MPKSDQEWAGFRRDQAASHMLESVSKQCWATSACIALSCLRASMLAFRRDLLHRCGVFHCCRDQDVSGASDGGKRAPPEGLRSAPRPNTVLQW
jgi:hypothetical protein